jgi:hypothetical protein
MTGIVVNTDGTVSKSDIQLHLLFRLSSYTVLVGNIKYILFYESSTTVQNEYISNIVKEPVYGPVTVVRKDNDGYHTPSLSEIRSLSRGQTVQNGCIIL